MTSETKANGVQLGDEKEGLAVGNGLASPGKQPVPMTRPIGPSRLTRRPRRDRVRKRRAPSSSERTKKPGNSQPQNVKEIRQPDPEPVPGFSRDQLKKLVRDVDGKHVQNREFDGKRLSYIEGWYAISQANAIFGHAGWDREMVHFERVMERIRSDSIVTCGYMARVRIRVRAGMTQVIREGTGWGSAAASTATAANERALKAAETDATKRALSTFGASFGLSLYDKDHVPAKASPLFTLYTPDGSPLDNALSPEAYCTGFRQLIEACKDTNQVDQLSRHNRASLADLRTQDPTLRNAQGVHFADLLLRLMQKRRERLSGASGASRNAESTSANEASGLDPRPVAEEGRGIPSEAGMDAAIAAAAAGQTTNGADGKRDAAPAASQTDGLRQRSFAAPREAFRRYTGRSSGRRQPYPFPSRSEVTQRQATVLSNAPPMTIATPAKGTSKEPGAAPGDSLNSAADTAPHPTPKTEAHEQSGPAAQAPVISVPALFREAPESFDPPSPPSKLAFGLKIDKSKLFLGLERRIRDKAHLRRVAELPCLVCNRQPSHAHHLRFAQRRGLSQKVSDEYVVPLCALHHGDLHHSASEQEWWGRRRIDPLAISTELWLSNRRP